MFIRNATSLYPDEMTVPMRRIVTWTRPAR